MQYNYKMNLHAKQLYVKWLKDGISDDKVKFRKTIQFAVYYILLYRHTYGSTCFQIVTINYGYINL